MLVVGEEEGEECFSCGGYEDMRERERGRGEGGGGEGGMSEGVGRKQQLWSLTVFMPSDDIGVWPHPPLGWPRLLSEVVVGRSLITG